MTGAKIPPPAAPDPPAPTTRTDALIGGVVKEMVPSEINTAIWRFEYAQVVGAKYAGNARPPLTIDGGGIITYPGRARQVELLDDAIEFRGHVVHAPAP